MDYRKTVLLTLAAATALAGEPKITCEPDALRGIPGEPLQIELTAVTDRAVSMQLRIPAASNLVVRTVERIPIRRTSDGRYVQKRIVIWQGVEAGTTTLTNLTAVFQDLEIKCPDLGITIEEVVPATPPARKEGE